MARTASPKPGVKGGWGSAPTLSQAAKKASVGARTSSRGTGLLKASAAGECMRVGRCSAARSELKKELCMQPWQGSVKLAAAAAPSTAQGAQHCTRPAHQSG